MSETFTIVSTGAGLVEVGGDGPGADLPGGLVVPDGVATNRPVDLLDGFERFFRVDAPASVTAKVNVTDSPFGALLTVRRCEARATTSAPTNGVARHEVPPSFDPVAFMPLAIRGIAHALWNMPVRDAVSVIVQATPMFIAAFSAWASASDVTESCTWTDVIEKSTGGIDVQGGDILVVSFVVP